MKLKQKTILVIATIEGAAKIFIAISIISLIVALVKILLSGFLTWQKDLFIFSALGVIIFFIIYLVLKQTIKYSERNSY